MKKVFLPVGRKGGKMYRPELRPGNKKKVINRKTGKPRQLGKKGNKKIYVWELRIELPKKEGKRNIKTHTFKGTVDEADAELYRLRAEYSNPYLADPTKITLGKYLRKWLEMKGAEKRTIQSYRAIIESHLIPALGDILLTDLQPYHIANYRDIKLQEGGRLDGKSGGLDAETVNKHLVILNSALEDAASPEKQLLPFNPAAPVKKARKVHVWEAAENYLIAEELSRLLSILEEIFSCYHPLTPELDESKKNILKKAGFTEKELKTRRVLSRFLVSRLYPLSFYGAFTGMRPSEILGVRWQDHCFTTNTISVCKSSHYTDEGHFFSGIKEKKIKVITMSEKLISFLKKYQKIQEEEKLFYGEEYEDNDLVFPDKKGRPIRNDTLSDNFVMFAKRNGFNIDFKGLRHTHATLLLMSGIPVVVVAQRLGHQKTSTTEDEYAHAIPSMQDRAAKIFDMIMEIKDVVTPEKLLEDKELLQKHLEAANKFDHIV